MTAVAWFLAGAVTVFVMIGLGAAMAIVWGLRRFKRSGGKWW